MKERKRNRFTVHASGMGVKLTMTCQAPDSDLYFDNMATREFYRGEC